VAAGAADAAGAPPPDAILVTIAPITLSLIPSPFNAMSWSGPVSYFPVCALIVLTTMSSPSPAFTILIIESLVSNV
jgi:hypothetical protein